MPRLCTVIFAVLPLCAAGAALAGRGTLAAAVTNAEAAAEEAWTAELSAIDASLAKNPIARVIELLTKMKSQLEQEGSNESDSYDKMVCWCQTNEKERSGSISSGEAEAAELESEVEARAAKHGSLATAIEQSKKQIAEEQASLKTATAIREKEAAAFSEEEKSMMQAITNLKNAISVLSKHNGGSFLQMESPELASVAVVLRDVATRYELMLGDGDGRSRFRPKSAASLLAVSGGGSLASALRAAMSGHGQSSSGVLPVDLAEQALASRARAVRGSLRHASDGASAFVQGAAPGYQSYAARSSGVFGILKQMKDEFEANLSDEQKQEMQAKEEFKALAASKIAQIEAAKKKLDTMETDHAGNQKALSDAKEDLALARGQRTEDVEFLRNLKLTCQSLDKQWQDRSATRAEELKAVSEAIVVLTEDDARDHLRKTVSLLQATSASTGSGAEFAAAKALRRRVAAGLRKAASAPGDLQDDLLTEWRGRGSPKEGLSNLAVSVELDNFATVKKAIDKMLEDLKAQQEQEVAKKAHCESEFSDNEKATFTKTSEKKDLEGKLDSLASAIATLKDEIKAAKTQTSEAEVEVKKAGAAREQQNAEFQAVVADQRATQAILKKALARLDAFYKKAALLATSEEPAALLQRGAASSARQTPPVKFNTYKNNKGSTSVMGLLEQIIEDSAKLEAEATEGERKAQASYETFVKDSNALISDLGKVVATKSKNVADAELASEMASSDHKDASSVLESLGQYEADLHVQCDFLLKNFDIRQRARTQEMEAIQEAKAFLSGQVAL